MADGAPTNYNDITIAAIKATTELVLKYNLSGSFDERREEWAKTYQSIISEVFPKE